MTPARFCATSRNGSLGLFESTRYARGHKALYTLEINGEHASIRWDLHDLHRLEWFDHNDEGRLRGWTSIHVTDHGGEHPYMDKWWVPGLQIGYEHTFVHQVADFIKSVEAGEPCHPTFRDAQETQQICDAVLDSTRKREPGRTFRRAASPSPLRRRCDVGIECACPGLPNTTHKPCREITL